MVNWRPAYNVHLLDITNIGDAYLRGWYAWGLYWI